MLPRRYKLKKDNDFKKVFKEGKYCQGEFVRIKYFKNELDFNRLAVIIGSKSFKKATERNQIKRRIEEIIRLNWQAIKPGFDIILIIQPMAKGKTYQEIEAELSALLKKIKIWDY
jgi:ribonuclease P protein component